MKKRTIISVALIFALVLGVGTYVVVTKPSPTSSPSRQDVLMAKDDRLSKGSSSAPVTIVEYADVLCPFCAKVHNEIMPRIQADYIDTKKAHYEIRLVAMLTPDSQRAAEGAYCAAEQGMFWDYMDDAYRETWRHYYSQNKRPDQVDLFSERRINQFAERVGLDMLEWQACMDEAKYASVLEKNRVEMTGIGAHGTPHFLFNGQSYSGAPPYSFFQKALDAEYNKMMSE